MIGSVLNAKRLMSRKSEARAPNPPPAFVDLGRGRRGLLRSLRGGVSSER